MPNAICAGEGENDMNPEEKKKFLEEFEGCLQLLKKKFFHLCRRDSSMQGVKLNQPRRGRKIPFQQKEEFSST